MLRSILILIAVLPVAAPQRVWTGTERIVAIGDVHGDYEQFTSVLADAGLIDAKGLWSGGRTHLVQTGDVPDRGPDTRKVMDLLMRLEKQAKKAGGRVYPLIGNHDAMNIYGDLRYVTPEEYAAFRDSGSNQVREAYYASELEDLKRRAANGEQVPKADSVFRADWMKKHPLGFFEHRKAFGSSGKYGRWVMSHDAVVKIDDTLFLHAGISPALEKSSVKELNAEIRRELRNFGLLKEGLAIADDGPLWYRGLAIGDERQLETHVDAVLENYGVKRIVIGHTPTAGAVMPRFGGKVLVIDVGLAKYYGGRRACLVIEDGKPYALHRGKRLELPSDSKGDLLRYLSAAAALDPPPSPLLPAIEKLQATLGPGK